MSSVSTSPSTRLRLNPRRGRRTLAAGAAIAALGLAGAGTAGAAPAGTLDSSFSGDGKQFTHFGSERDLATDLARQRDGKLVAAGTARGDSAVARYKADGSLDRSFSGDGKVTLNFGGRDYLEGVAVQGDGKIVVAGTARGGDPETDPRQRKRVFAVARLNADGSLDQTFSADGKLLTNFAGDGEYATDLALGRGGVVVVVGSAATPSGGEVGFALARYRPDGTPDPSFSGDGKQTSQTGFSSSHYAEAVAVQRDGGIVVAGKFRFAEGEVVEEFLVARYTSAGELDQGFGEGGRTQVGFSSGDTSVNGVAVQPDGRIVAAGYTSRFDSGIDGSGPPRIALARLQTNGRLDKSFAGDGKQLTKVGNGSSASAVALQRDGRIVVAGGSDGKFALTRYTTAGTLDQSFSGDGIVLTPLGGSFASTGEETFGEASGLVVAGERIIAAGYRGFAGPADDRADYDFALVRYR